MYTSNLPIIYTPFGGSQDYFKHSRIGYSTRCGKKKTRENRTVGKILYLLKSAVRTLLQKCRFTPFTTFVIGIPRVTMNKLPVV